MEIETRQAALCVFRRKDVFLVAEIRDPLTGVVLHRPPGGGIEEGESPEEAVRRELEEELGVRLTASDSLVKSITSGFGKVGKSVSRPGYFWRTPPMMNA